MEDAKEEALGILNRNIEQKWRDKVHQATGAKNYTGGHWDEPNVLAHYRSNERMIDGDKSLFVEEWQSDWLQRGRKEGFVGDASEKKAIDTRIKELVKEREVLAKNRDPVTNQMVEESRWHDLAREGEELQAQWQKLDQGVPNAPYKKNWHDLAFRRSLRDAAERDMDRIAWTPGEVQADRYDLSKQISKVELSTTSGGVGKAPSGEFKAGMLEAYDIDGAKIINEYIDSPEELAEYIGKDAADKLLAAEGKHGNSAGMGRYTRSIKDQDLKVGGEGMKEFYDKMMVKTANKFGKKYGVKVEVKKIKTRPGSGERLDTLSDISGVDVVDEDTLQEVWSMKLTPEMKRDILKGGVALSGAGIMAPSLVESLTGERY